MPGEIMVMIVTVRVYRQALSFLPAKQGKIGRIYTHLLWSAMTADVMIQTDDFVGARHDQMQIVRDHEDTALMAAADVVDELIQLGLPTHVDTLCRFIKYQQLWRL